MNTAGFENDIQNCLKVLKAGGIILYPTDTIWGLGCDATNEEAVSKIYRIKQRDDSKALIVLAASEQDVMRYSATVDLSVFDYLETTEKPTTVIYENAIGLAENLLAADGSVGIRICKEPFCKALIKRFGKPVVSTSANRSGTPASAIFNELDEEIKALVDYTVLYRQTDICPATASSVIKWDRGAPVFIRK